LIVLCEARLKRRLGELQVCGVSIILCDDVRLCLAGPY
jgi:hypothetical protein